jgi:hypothetical protein
LLFYTKEKCSGTLFLYIQVECFSRGWLSKPVYL